MINTRKCDNLFIFDWTMKDLYLHLNLDLNLCLDLDLGLDAAESPCICELRVWITTLFSSF